jgi:hypothetical protein
VILGLKRARELIAGGWSGPDLEPLCVARGPGVRLNPARIDRSEPFAELWLPTKMFHTVNVEVGTIARFSVQCALYAVGLGDEAWLVLERMSGAANGLDDWLRTAGRTTEDVLRVFTLAIQRSKKGERR